MIKPITVAQYFDYVEKYEKWLESVKALYIKDDNVVKNYNNNFSASTIVVPIIGLTPLIVNKFPKHFMNGLMIF
jgi:hypothetical protein